MNASDAIDVIATKAKVDALTRVAMHTIRAVIEHPSCTQEIRESIFDALMSGYCRVCGKPIDSSTGQCRLKC